MKRVLLSAFVALAACITAAAQDAASVAMDFSAMPRSAEALSQGGLNFLETAGSRLAAGRDFSARLDFAKWKSASPTTAINADVYKAFGEKFAANLVLSSCKGEEYQNYTGLGVSSGTFTPKDLLLGVGFAFKTDPVVVEIAGSFLSRALAPEKKITAISVDILASSSLLDDNLAVTGGLMGLGTTVESASGDKYHIPMAITAGGNYSLPFGLGVGTQIDYYIFGGGLRAGFGAEYAFKDMVFVRAGYNFGGHTFLPSYLSAGLGVKFAGASLNFAYLLASDTLAGSLLLGVAYAF